MYKKFVFLCLSLTILSVSCVKDVNPVVIDLNKSYLSGKGVFILNEGNFRGGNGSLSFFSYDSLKIYNHVFLSVNQRPLGDVPNYMSFNGSKAYIIVNNSGKVEVVNRIDMKSIATIEGLNSPRNISFVSEIKAYVTSLYSDSVTILDLTTNSVQGYIDLKNTSESIVNLYSTAYVANWSGGNKIFAINTVTDQVIDSVEVGFEPESMVIDKNETLWVLCNGGWQREHKAELIGIDTRTNGIIERYEFPSIDDSPTCLQIDEGQEFLYFLMDGVYRMSIGAGSLPASALIPQAGHLFYKLGVDPSNSEIYVTDVVDYVQTGKIIRYKNNGSLVAEYAADIIPGSVCFKEYNDSVIE